MDGHGQIGHDCHDETQEDWDRASGSPNPQRRRECSSAGRGCVSSQSMCCMAGVELTEAGKYQCEHSSHPGTTLPSHVPPVRCWCVARVT
jgi:hypothetical protein